MVRNGGPLDHVVINVRDRMDEAAGLFRRMGFQLTPRGHHTLGSINHLMILGPDYLELVGVPAGTGGQVRADIAGAPIGLNGIVLRTEDSAALHAELAALSIPVDPPLAFSRPVELPGGARDAKFQVVRLKPDPLLGGRVYFCQHYTKPLVWRGEWRHHANGAWAVDTLTVASEDPAGAASVYRTMLGPAACGDSGGTVVVRLGHARVEFMTPAALRNRYGDAAPDAAGRTTFMAGIALRTASVSRAAEVLAAGGVETTAREANRIVVPARCAMNTLIEFCA